MSAKNRGLATNDPLDRYYTPAWAVDLCMSEIIIPIYGSLGIRNVLEPSAGGGAFVRGLRSLNGIMEFHISAIDTDPEAGPWPEADESYEGDFLETDFAEVDLIIGNPPYAPALEHCEEALRISDNVVFLLRQGFMSSERRHPFWKKHPPSHVFLLPNRPSFIVGKTGGDSADYAFICWSKDSTKTELHWLPVTPKEQRR